MSESSVDKIAVRFSNASPVFVILITKLPDSPASKRVSESPVSAIKTTWRGLTETAENVLANTSYQKCSSSRWLLDQVITKSPIEFELTAGISCL